MVAQIMKRSKNARYYSANPTTPAARPQIMTKSFAIAISKNNPPPHVGAVVYECEISECPPPTGPRANIVCVGGSGRGVGHNDHPVDYVDTPPQRGTWLSSRRGISSPPLEGCPNTGPRATCRVGGSGGVVREFKNMHLLSIVIASKAWRSSK